MMTQVKILYTQSVFHHPSQDKIGLSQNTKRMCEVGVTLCLFKMSSLGSMSVI